MYFKFFLLKPVSCLGKKESKLYISEKMRMLFIEHNKKAFLTYRGKLYLSTGCLYKRLR